MSENNYKGYLIIDWRKGSMRLRQSIPNLRPYEVAVKFKVAIKVPDLSIPVVNLGTIEIPETKVEKTEFDPLPMTQDG